MEFEILEQARGWDPDFNPRLHSAIDFNHLLATNHQLRARYVVRSTERDHRVNVQLKDLPDDFQDLTKPSQGAVIFLKNYVWDKNGSNKKESVDIPELGDKRRKEKEEKEAMLKLKRQELNRQKSLEAMKDSEAKSNPSSPVLENHNRKSLLTGSPVAEEVSIMLDLTPPNFNSLELHEEESNLLLTENKPEKEPEMTSKRKHKSSKKKKRKKEKIKKLLASVDIEELTETRKSKKSKKMKIERPSDIVTKSEVMSGKDLKVQKFFADYIRELLKDHRIRTQYAILVSTKISQKLFTSWKMNPRGHQKPTQFLIDKLATINILIENYIKKMEDKYLDFYKHDKEKK